MGKRKDNVLRISTHETVTVLESGGDKLVVEAEYRPNGTPPPTHYHPSQDEHFTVLSGTLMVEVGGKKSELTAGDEFTIKRRQVHRMWNATSDVARVGWVTTPALSTEDWFRGLADLHHHTVTVGRDRPAPREFAKLAKQHRATFRLVMGPKPVGDLLVRVLSIGR